MKILSTLEANQVSGGSLVRIGGKTISVNTYGIPQTCVNKIVAMTNDIYHSVETSYNSFGSTFAIMGQHMDNIENADCLQYIETFNQRLSTASLA